MSKRPGFDMKALAAKKARMDQQVAVHRQNAAPKNKFLSNPCPPANAIKHFLVQARTDARKFLPKEQQIFPIKTPFCEIEARLGLLTVPHSVPQRRIVSSGAKHHQGQLVQTFDCSGMPTQLVSGVSRSHFTKWTTATEVSPLTQALGVTDPAKLKTDLVEHEYVETVYSGYAQERRVCYPGLHDLHASGKPLTGKMEAKQKLVTQDLLVPAAGYDLRIGLASEKCLDPAVPNTPPPGWTAKRVKRRRSYTRRDKFYWQIDVTEVTTTTKDSMQAPHVDYEIELELREEIMLQLINQQDMNNVKAMTQDIANQLWWMLSQLNPLQDALDVEESLQDHPNTQAVSLALATCGALKQFMDSGASAHYESPIARPQQAPPASMSNIKFPGCMPINFARHNIEEIQRSPSNAYYISEKTDGVRHLMIFTGSTVVLVDRAMRGKQPIPKEKGKEPFAPILDLIKPGTVLDGEVVMNRRGRKPRPIFIVFDVMAVSTTEPCLHLPFEKRYEYLKSARFRSTTANRDMFDARFLADLNFPLPLVRKNFVQRTDLDDLFSHVVEERGMRCYRNGDLHNHLTDGIIFQPDRPYVCGTDRGLLKWKYLDTATIDVEILPLLHNDDDNTLRVGCLGEEDTRVDMTRHIMLPPSERMRMEADRFEGGGRIAEVGFDPETGEWYYLTMRADKIAPNHISTVLGTLMELGEGLTADELRFRMSVPTGTRDVYRKELRKMLGSLLAHQRKTLNHLKRSGH